ncbi:class I SAM-dependent methyltransferase [Longispora sp. K20-0274]|uniref:class I SAM-dependent methyltransferase n=1 Tax=Longispora sp. K20-0274 TaxID=3088255 RepID=UPI00399B6FB0
MRDGTGGPGAVRDTALLAAAFRAAESRRPRPRVIDPHAQLFLADGPGPPAALRAGGEHVVERTRIVDALLDTVPGTIVNLGAGYCTRPYRLDLAGRPVVEVDSPDVIATKERVLAEYTPRGPVRRIGLDLRDHAALGAALATVEGPVVLLTEGVLPYLPTDAVAALGRVLARPGAVWLTDVVSVASAGAMAAVAPGLTLYGLDSLAPFEGAGWTVTDYRLLPVMTTTRPGAGSRDVVDGVLTLRAAPRV